MKTLCMVMMAFLASALFAQPMIGTYLIGGPTPDFSSLQTAIDSLETRGFGGDVVFQLEAGTHEGPFVCALGNHAHTLSITSGSADPDQVVLTNPLSSSTENYILYIDETTDTVIDGVSFAPIGNYARSIVVRGNSDYTTIQNCLFTGTVNTNTSNAEHIYFINDGEYDSDYVTIQDNVFLDGDYHININSGNYNNDFSNWQIQNNTHTGGYGGIYLGRASDMEISGETMSSVNTGIYLNGCDGAISIHNNDVSAYATGIYLEYSDTFDTGTPHIYNNIIRVDGYYWYNGYGWATAHGLALYNCEDFVVAHNSVLNTSYAYNSTVAFISGDDNQIRMNHFVSLGRAYGIYANNIDPGAAHPNLIEHNNIYSRYTWIAKSMNTSFLELDEFNAHIGLYNSDCNPMYEDDQLHTTLPVLDNFGIHCNVDTDFGGNPRNTTTPDIGAWEYTAPAGNDPLSGTYDIGSGGDYATLEDFLHDLTYRGVNAAVTAQLTDSLYTGAYILDHIPGIGWDRILTFTGATGQTPVLRYSNQDEDNNHLFRLYRGKYVTFDGFTFETEATGYSNLVVLDGFNKFINFDTCQFVAPGNQGSSYTAFSVYTPDNAWLGETSFEDCTFSGNSCGIDIILETGSIEGCTFDGNYRGASFQPGNNVTITDCDFSDISYVGLSVNGSSAFTVTNNRFTGSSRGMAIENCNATGERILIANNILDLTGGNSGITVSGTGFNIINNSVRSTGSNGRGIACYYFPAQCDIMNNILVAPEGLALDMTNYSPSADKVLDYNCYYTESNSLVKLQTVYDDLQDLQTALPEFDQHSLALNPHFTGDLHTGSPWLRQAGFNRPEITDDIDGDLRLPGFDIGADQQTGTYTGAPLAGSYTVGTASSDFPTIETALQQLDENGIDGDVEFLIQSGVYPGGYSVYDYPRTSPELGVTFTGSPGNLFTLVPVEPYPTDNFIFRLVGADNITFDGLMMETQTVSTQSRFIQTVGKCDNLQILNCQFDLFNNSHQGVNTGTSISENLLIEQCVFTEGSYGVVISGDYYNNNRYRNVTIQNSAFTDTDYPLSLSNVNDLEISGNNIQAFTTAFGLAATGGTVTIHRNRMLTGGLAGGYSQISCASISNSGEGESDLINLANNIIYMKNSACQAATGLAVTSSERVTLNHNTIIVENRLYFEYGSALSCSSSDSLFFLNNIFSSPQQGYAVSLNSVTSAQWLGNSFYNSARDAGKIGNEYYNIQDLLYTQLGDLQATFANPLPDENGYPTCSWIRGTGVHTSVQTDIDGNPHSWNSDPGATVIPDLGPLFYNNVTVGPAGDYPDLPSAFLDIMRRGISGDVNLLLEPGIYTGQAELGLVPNTLFGATLTIKPQTPGTVELSWNATGSSDNRILSLNNTRNVSLEDLLFTPQNPSWSTCVDVDRYTAGLSVTGCRFFVDANNLTSQYSTAVYGYEFPFDNLTVMDCDIENFGYGVYLRGMAGTPIVNSGLSISGNEILNTYTGMMLEQMLAPVLTANTISDFRGTGVNLTDSDGITITGNSIQGSGNYGILLDDLTGSEDWIINNFIGVEGSPNAGLSIQDAAEVNVLFNTIRTNSTYSSSKAFNQQDDCPGLELVNNILTGGQAAVVQLYNAGDVAALSHNVYHGAGTAVVLVNGTACNDEPAYQASTGDMTSLLTDPLLGDGYYTLEGSVAIDSGIAITGIDTDIDGHPRDIPDRGCWEYRVQQLDTPQNVTITIDTAQNLATLTWDPVTGAGGYRVYASSSPDGENWSFVEVPGTTATVSLTENQRFFRVSAVDSIRVSRDNRSQ